MASKRVTSFDVARMVGVSQSTVSRTFGSGANVSEKTRKKIVAAAKELGYKPDAIARSLSTQKTNIVGIVMAQITSPFYPYVLEMFTKRLQDIGRQALLFTTAPGQEVDDILPHVLQYRVDGLIITSSLVSSEMVEECAQSGTPVVLFNRYALGTQTSAICCDNVEGGRAIANLLLDAGHQRLAYIAGLENTSTNIDREKGFSDRLNERGYTQLLREKGQYNYKSGFEAAKRLLKNTNPPDAIFCANDIMALGALDAARFEVGLKVPEDVSIIGFDDIPSASWDAYALTTIRQPVDKMVDATLDLLLQRIESPDAEPTLKLISGQLIKRQSVRF